MTSEILDKWVVKDVLNFVLIPSKLRIVYDEGDFYGERATKFFIYEWAKIAMGYIIKQVGGCDFVGVIC